MKFCSASSASASVSVAMNSMCPISSSRPWAPRVEGLEKCDATLFLSDFASVEAMRAGAEGCEYGFHAAAKVEDWGTREEFERDNVGGTRNALRAAREAGVRRFVHVGTEAALLAGQPLVDANEDDPLRPDSPALYSSTKAKAEQAVRDANGEGFETVVVRP